jgi:hypothetical protein
MAIDTPACAAETLAACPMVEEMIAATIHRLDRRKDDPIIVEIHSRLDRMEGIEQKAQVILNWIETMGHVTAAVERLGVFLTKWSVRFTKIAAAGTLLWALRNYTLHEIWTVIRKG